MQISGGVTLSGGVNLAPGSGGSSGGPIPSATHGFTSAGSKLNSGHYGLSDFIDKFPFATEGSSTDIGDLTVNRKYVSGQSSTENGYTSGGTPALNIIDKFPFASNGNASDVGDLAIGKTASCGQQSSDNGYASGGYGSSTWDPGNRAIQKFPFASDSNATNIGDITQVFQNNPGRWYSAGHSSSENGYTSGGDNASYGRTNVIDKFPFASDSDATDVGDLLALNNQACGQSSTTHGYVSGGYDTIAGVYGLDTIQKFTFSADNNATDVGNLVGGTRLNYKQAGQSGPTDGYVSGGYDSELWGNVINNIQKYPFASDNNSTDVGTLSDALFECTGQQG